MCVGGGIYPPHMVKHERNIFELRWSVVTTLFKIYEP